MSRTDVHRPWKVQINDPYNRHILYRWQITGHEVWITSFRHIGCGCRMCTGHHWNRADRRRSRHQWKQRRIKLLKTKEFE